MRTLKALLCLSALAGSLATSVAADNVYSLNVVGYVNVPLVGNAAGYYNMIANPLKAPVNTIGALLPAPPNFTTAYKYTGAGFAISSFVFGAWEDDTISLNPGEGIIIQSMEPFTQTFVGEVMTGNLTNAYPAGLSIRSSMVPQAGTLTELGLTGLSNFDTVYQWNSVAQGYDVFSFTFGSWSPSEPTLKVGESIWLETAAAGNWVRVFNIP